MKVQVRLYAVLRRYHPDGGSQGLDLDLAEGAAVAHVIQHLTIPHGEHLVAMVNSTVRDLDHLLVEGDVVSLFPPVAGG